MSLPRVSVLFANGNLLGNIAAVDGIAGLICSGVATGSMPLKTPKQLFELADLAALGVTGAVSILTNSSTTFDTMMLTLEEGDEVSVTLAGGQVLGTTTMLAETGNITLSRLANGINSNLSPTFYGSYYSPGLTIGGQLPNGTMIALRINGAVVAEQATNGGTSQVVNEHLYRQVKEYYDAVGGRQELWVMTVANTVTMAEMLNKNTTDHAPALLAAGGGRIRLLAVCRQPDGAYDGGTDFIDSDVPAALAAGKQLVQAQQDGLNFLRVLVEGRVANTTSTSYFEPKVSSNGYAGVVLGGSRNDGSASVGTILGRACRYGAHIKVGKVANGPLPITTAYIGAKEVSTLSNLGYLHGLGYISFMSHPGKSGYYAGIDRMASTDDYRLLAYGRLVDKAATIAAAVYIDSLESEVELQADGKIASQEVAYLRAIVSQQIQALMGDQISGHQVLIAEDQNIVNTGKLVVQLRIQPLGYTSFIEVTVGLTATA